MMNNFLAFRKMEKVGFRERYGNIPLTFAYKEWIRIFGN